MPRKTDVLIIGSGMSGLFFAIKLAQKSPDKSILIITKNEAIESSSLYAQGGIADHSD